MNENINENATDRLTQNKQKSFRKIAIISIIAVFACIIALTITVIILGSKISDVQDRLTLNENYIAAQNSKVYEYATPDDVVNIDNLTYGDTWIKLLPDVPLNSLNYDNLEFKDGRYSYFVNDVPASFCGIDVSYHQDYIDWELVAEDGIDFALVRLGFRGYETGLINPDIMAEKYIQGALEAGIDVGAYFFSQAITEEEAIAEAKFVIEKLDGYEITYPVVFDWELPTDDNARTKDVTATKLNKIAVAFCDEIAEAGYTPMIYSNLMLSLTKFDMSKLEPYDFWYVEYEHGYNPPDYPYEIDIWQYASDGSVNGISGDVDLNICFTDYPLKYKVTHSELD